MFGRNVPFTIDFPTASELLGFDTEAVMNADPRDFPARKSNNIPPLYEQYADVIPEIREQVNVFNDSFNDRGIVYYLKSERWPEYFPVSACRELHPVSKSHVISNASVITGIGRQMEIADIIFNIRDSWHYGEYGLILFGVMHQELGEVRETQHELLLDPIKHVLRTLDAPSKAEAYLIDALIRLHWEKWRDKCPHVDYGNRYFENTPDIPETIHLKAGDRYGIEYNDSSGFRGFIEGLHRLAKLNTIIKSLDHRGIYIHVDNGGMKVAGANKAIL